MESSSNNNELRLFLEEMCCELCRFRRMADAGITPESISIDRDVPLGRPGAFADIHVTEPGALSYLVEIKYAVPVVDLLERLRAKYGVMSDVIKQTRRLIVVVGGQNGNCADDLQARIQQVVTPSLQVEVWDEAELIRQIESYLQFRIPAINAQTLLDVRDAVQRKKGFIAFGGESLESFRNDALAEELLWRLSFWRLRQLREARGLKPREILPPGLYRQVVVVIADLCSFSSYVRDTPDDQVLRASLTSFYSKSRFEVVHRGGMLESFVGDQVLAMFGVPDQQPGYVEDALNAAKALLSIGDAVSSEWQRRIDRVQPSGGMHVGIAYGDIQIVPLRPSSRTHVTTIADIINVAARLMSGSNAGEITVTNTFYHNLPPSARRGFSEMEPQEGRNVGRIKGWKFRSPTAF